jgi:hypothetical protein
MNIRNRAAPPPHRSQAPIQHPSDPGYDGDHSSPAEPGSSPPWPVIPPVQRTAQGFEFAPRKNTGSKYVTNEGMNLAYSNIYSNLYFCTDFDAFKDEISKQFVEFHDQDLQNENSQRTNEVEIKQLQSLVTVLLKELEGLTGKQLVKPSEKPVF